MGGDTRRGKQYLVREGLFGEGDDLGAGSRGQDREYRDGYHQEVVDREAGAAAKSRIHGWSRGWGRQREGLNGKLDARVPFPAGTWQRPPSRRSSLAAGVQRTSR